MEEATNRPRVFVSSTIYDFRDLRSALQYWLREMGLEVRMSEVNDFQRRPEDGTFESCFKAIDGCDYYILLVGARKGSDYANGISVTQQEYRVAAELAKQDRIRPVIFIRSEVETALREWRARRRRTERPPAGRSRKTPALEDPDFVDRFVNEVQTTEVQRKGAYPTPGYMWIYSFKTFEELTTALRQTLNLYRSVRRQALLANLKWECDENIAALCMKRSNLPIRKYQWIARLREKVKPKVEKILDPVSLTLQQARAISGFRYTSLADPGRLGHTALDDALTTGEFLIYQSRSETLVDGPVQIAMRNLRLAIESYRQAFAALQLRAPHFTELHLKVLNDEQDLWISGIDLVYLYRVHDTMVDILRLSAALSAFALDPEAGSLQLPELSPVTPVAEWVDIVQSEQPSHRDVEDWVRNPVMRDLITGEQKGTVEDLRRAVEQYPSLAEAVRRRQAQFWEVLELHQDELRSRLQSDSPEEFMAWVRGLSGETS